MRIAIFGGTFDPPHLGHRAAVDGLFRNPGVERVVVLPNGAPALKAAITAPEHRLEMARLAFLDRPAGPVEVNDHEIQESRLRPGQPIYSFDSLQALQTRYGADLAMVIGIDQLTQLPLWNRFPDVLRVAHWIVLERKPISRKAITEALQPLLASRLIEPLSDSEWRIPGNPIGTGKPRRMKLVPTEAPAISSTYIRETLARTGHPPAETLHPSVEAYLKGNHLYGSRLDSSDTDPSKELWKRSERNGNK